MKSREINIGRYNTGMNNKFYVSIEAAKLLKEKGYDKPTDYIYVIDGQFYSIWRNKDGNMESNYYAAPTKAEAIDWLESKGIVVCVYLLDLSTWSYTIIAHKDKHIFRDFFEDKTRLEAEEYAIIKALELL